MFFNKRDQKSRRLRVRKKKITKQNFKEALKSEYGVFNKKFIFSIIGIIVGFILILLEISSDTVIKIPFGDKNWELTTGLPGLVIIIVTVVSFLISVKTDTVLQESETND